jgi:hypothetical protein
VSHKAPFHRWYLFAGKGFSLLVGVLVHICKDNYISSYLQLFRTFFHPKSLYSTRFCIENKKEKRVSLLYFARLFFDLKVQSDKSITYL